MPRVCTAMATFCVIDNNLVSYPSPRRFLMGLAALTGERFAVTPTVRTEMFDSVCYAERLFIREQATEWRPDYFHMVEECVNAWLDEDFLGPSGVFDVQAAESKAARAEWIDRLPAEAFKAETDSAITNDMKIVADALASGADAVMTNNCGSMFHHVLNEWAVRSGVRNSEFLLDPPLGVARLLKRHGMAFPNGPVLHQCAINMVMPRVRQSPEDERALLLRFARKLNTDMPAIGNAVAAEERTLERDARWERAAQMIHLEAWQHVRAVEDRRMTRMRKGRKAAGLDF